MRTYAVQHFSINWLKRFRSFCKPWTMKTSITTLVTILFVSLLSSPSWGDGISFDDLVERGGLYYKKFTDVPFTGNIGSH